MQRSLIAELAATVRGYAAQENLSFLGRVSVELESDPSLRVGLFRLHPSYDERLPEVEPDGWLEGPDGTRGSAQERSDDDRSDLDGRHRPQRSKRLASRHAELHPVGDTYQLVDLGSTNGCKVNGQRIERQVLVDGDEITLGPVKLRFRRL